MKIHIFLKDKWLPKVLMAALLATPLWGSAQTEIADKPVFSSSDAEIKPNVMLLMDTSDSMAWSHMPDDLVKPIDTVTFYRQPVGYKNHLCNAMYYNPEQSYPLPIGADGKPLPEPSFTAAYYNYYLDPSVKVDLSNAFRAHDSLTIKDQLAKEDLPQEAYYYEFSGTNPAINSLTAYANKPCRDDDFYEKAGDPLKKAATGGGEWIRKTPKTVAEQKNFAIWYSYYRTRMLMAKSAVQSAFSSIPEGRYRVGFISVDPKDKATKNVDPAKYVKIADFGGVARQAWFNKVSSQVAEGYSPAREGLARVGRLYGGKFDLINQGIPAADDPLLADDGKTLISCRPNFTILTTDGYWNKVSERDVFERFDLPGTQKVGGTDNLLTGDGVCNKTGAACTPRGIFDGAQDGASYEKRKATLYEFTSSGCSLGLRKYEQVSYMRKEVKKYVRSMETTGGNIVLDMAVKTTKKNETQKFQNRLVETEYKVVPTNAKMVQIQYQGICGEAVCALPDCSPATISKYSVTSCAPKTLVDKYITLAEAKACQNTDTSSPSFKHPYVITKCTTGGNVICRDNVSDSSKPGFVAGCTPPVVKRDLILAKGDLCTNQSAKPTEPKTTEIVCSEVTQPSVGSVSCPALSYDPSTKTYTRCVTTQYAPSRVPASSCTPSLGSAANGFIETSCVYYCSDPSKCPSTGGGSAAKGRYCPNGAKLPGIGPDGRESFEWCGTANVSPATVVDPLTCTAGVVDTAGDKTYTDCIPVTQSKNYTTSCDWSGKKKTTNAANEPTVTECGEENDPGYKITKRTSTIWRDEYAPPAAPGPWSSVSWSASTDETDCKKNELPPADWPRYGVAIPPGAPLAGNPFPRYQYKDEGTETIAPISSTGGSFNSLADVSQYYYKTDLRPSLADDVRPIGTNWYSDTATHQHMTTFVLGLGVSGQKRYQEDYLTAATGDFADIRAGKSN